MEKQILEIMRRAFQCDDVDINISQKTCKSWDSLHHLDLIVELENEFGISFEPEEIAEMVDFNTVVKILKTKL